MSRFDDDLPFARRPVFLGALRMALARASIWTFTWLVFLVLGAIAALPFFEWFDQTLEQRYEPGSLRASMDAAFRFDHRASLGEVNESAGHVLAGMALIAMLFGAFAAGGWLQVFLERSRGNTLKRFLWGGSRYFLRFVRVWLCTVLILSLLTWLLHGWFWEKVVLDLVFGATDGKLEVLSSERSAVRIEWLQTLLYAIGFALVLVWGDYTRVRMALHDTRSAIWAGLCTWFIMLRYPVRMIRPHLLLLGIEALSLAFLGWLSWGRNVGMGPDSGWLVLIFLFAVGQLSLIVQSILRGARYQATVQVSRRLVPPLAQPDPWAKRIGGPGGPQYPIEESDEYGVSI